MHSEQEVIKDVVTIKLVDVMIMREEKRNEDLKKEVTDSSQAMMCSDFAAFQSTNHY